MQFILALLLASSLSPITPGNSARSPEWVQPGSGSRSPFINVRAAPYFAACDGSTDDAATIQNAINALSSGTVVIPGNVTCMVSGLTMKSNVWIRCEGATLKMPANAAINAKMFNFASVSNTGLRGACYLDGNRANQTNTGNNGQFGVLIGASASDIGIDYVYATGFSEDSLYIGIGGLDPSTTPKGISIGTFISDNATRNGGSITNGKNISIGYFEGRLTHGAAPEAGIDFETNFSTDTLSNIKFGYLNVHDNNGYGYQILGQISGTTLVHGWTTIGRLDSYSNLTGGGLMFKVRNVETPDVAIHDNAGPGLFLPRDLRHIKVGGEIYKNTQRGIDAAMTSQDFASSDFDFSGLIVRDNSQSPTNTADGIKLDSDDAAKVLTRVRGTGVALYDGQGSPTQRFGMTTGANTSGIELEGYVPSNATGSYTIGGQGYVEAAPRLYSSQTINYSVAILNATCNVQNLTVTGAATNDTAILSPTGMVDGMFAFGFAGTNVVRISMCNLSGSSQTPGTIRFQMTIVKH